MFKQGSNLGPQGQPRWMDSPAGGHHIQIVNVVPGNIKMPAR